MNQKFDRLVTLLKELFQLDQPDLDFGLYRIMHAKSGEVSQFLQRDLLPQVRDAFSQYQTADRTMLQKELDKAIESAKELGGVDPESTKKVKELRARLATEAVDLDALESEIYDHLFDKSREDIVKKLEELRDSIKRGELRELNFEGIRAIWFGHRLLYEPLLYLEGNVVEISPAPLNKGERAFVDDLRSYTELHPDFLSGRELYLLRNLSKGKGVGFFEEGNFFPDLILWVVEGEQQHVAFVDPKGIRNVPLNDPKIRFHQTIKTIEQRLAGTSVQLHAFIVSNTHSSVMERHWGIEKAAMLQRNIVFQEEDKEIYVSRILEQLTVPV